MKTAVAIALSVALLSWIFAGRRRLTAEGVRGRASWYGEGYRGKRMANGADFDPEAMTCAAWDWPLGSLLQVKHMGTGTVVIVEVTDHGPARWTKCIIDLSARAFRRLADPNVGKIVVEITPTRIGPEQPERPHVRTGGGE